jgi:Cys-tRNA(Pro)/Cys-tRNA(Cys) deacylase
VKTRALEILDRLAISYETRAYEHGELTAPEVAARIGLPAAQTFKTLVCRVEGLPARPGGSGAAGVVLAVVPGDRELDLKALARAAGGKRADLVLVGEIERLTGYIRGGCSPLGARRAGKEAGYPVFLDAAARAFPFISVSAGVRGLQVLLAPEDLARAAGATVVAGLAGRSPSP